GVGAFIALMLVIALLVGTRLHRRLHAALLNKSDFG
ncbi:hypothetical protein V3G67_25250, partial [Escherichia coli]